VFPSGLVELFKDFDLTAVKLDEISFVTRGANKKTYCLIKSGDLVRKIELNEDILKSILETPDEDLDKVLKDLKLDDEALEGIVGAARVLKSYKDNLPENALEILAKACDLKLPDDKQQQQQQQKAGNGQGQGGNGNGDGRGSGDGKKDDKKDDDQGYGYPDVGKMSKKELKKALEGTNPALTALVLKMHSDMEAANKRAAASDIAIKGLQMEKTEGIYLKKADELSDLPIPQDFHKTLMALGEGHPEEFDQLFNVLKSANKMVADSETMRETGRVAKGERAGTVAMEVFSKARQLLNKSSENMSFQDAIAKILDGDSELYERYSKEEKARVDAGLLPVIRYG